MYILQLNTNEKSLKDGGDAQGGGMPTEISYPARRARALRALGLLLADGVPIVGLVKTFWRETGRTGRKRA